MREYVGGTRCQQVSARNFKIYSRHGQDRVLMDYEMAIWPVHRIRFSTSKVDTTTRHSIVSCSFPFFYFKKGSIFGIPRCLMLNFFLNRHRTTNNREDGIFSLDKRKIQRDRRLRWNRNDENEKLQLRCFPIEQWRCTAVVRKTRTCPPMSLFPSPLSFPLPESTPL